MSIILDVARFEGQEISNKTSMIGSHMPHWRSRPTSKSNGEYDKRWARGPSTPRWVKVCWVVALIAIAMFVILHLTDNGYGHRMHMSTMEHGAER